MTSNNPAHKKKICLVRVHRQLMYIHCSAQSRTLLWGGSLLHFSSSESNEMVADTQRWWLQLCNQTGHADEQPNQSDGHQTSRVAERQCVQTQVIKEQD